MNLVEKTDDEILKLANPIWDGLIESSNKKDYGAFSMVNLPVLGSRRDRVRQCQFSSSNFI